jgi:type 1 glutamine amidotransferase
MKALALLSLALLGHLSSQAADAPAKPIRALLISGGCCHDYPRQDVILSQGISARANVQWTIVRDPSTGTSAKVAVYQKDDWAKDFDVIVHNECFSDEKDPAWLERILKPHREGVPGLVIHCAMHCYRAPSDEWFKFCGVTSRRHGSHFDYPIRLEKADHPIVKGLPTQWQTPKEELYIIEKVWPDAHPLTSGYSHETKRHEPNAWINTYGKARVFGTTIGHYNATMEQPWFLDLTTRGLLWACGKLAEDGKPLPGYQAAAK